MFNKVQAIMGQSACFHTLYISAKCELLYQTGFLYLPNTKLQNYFKSTKENLRLISVLFHVEQRQNSTNDIDTMGNSLEI